MRNKKKTFIIESGRKERDVQIKNKRELLDLQIKNKRGQLKIQQTTFMIIAVFLFFIIVGLFYAVVNLSQLNQEATNLERERIVGMAARVSSIPELNFNGKLNTLDFDKIMMIKDDASYKEFFGIDSMLIRKIDSKRQDIECKSSNYPDCNLVKIFTKENISINPSSSVFVSLCRKQSFQGKSYDKCELARVSIAIKNSEK